MTQIKFTTHDLYFQCKEIKNRAKQYYGVGVNQLFYGTKEYLTEDCLKFIFQPVLNSLFTLEMLVKQLNHFDLITIDFDSDY